ncbi:hypothetical protein LV779_19485 [Streptomyces thinghirensis]|nr:hypothetical protein [Streptomyces thinghirensis]
MPAARLFLAGWLGMTDPDRRGGTPALRLLRQDFTISHFIVFDAFILAAEAWIANPGGPARGVPGQGPQVAGAGRGPAVHGHRPAHAPGCPDHRRDGAGPRGRRAPGRGRRPLHRRRRRDAAAEPRLDGPGAGRARPGHRAGPRGDRRRGVRGRVRRGHRPLPFRRPSPSSDPGRVRSSYGTCGWRPAPSPP